MERGNVLYGKIVREKLINEIREEVKNLRKQGKSPLLMTLEVGDNPASKVYLSSQRRTAEEVGINYESIQLSSETTQERLLNVIRDINQDPYINGLILHMPLPGHINAKIAQWSIDKKKDVEGVTPSNLGQLFLGMPGLIPCTAQSIVALIKSTGVDLKGKEITVIGHSDIVGKPVAMLLMQQEATVTVCQYETFKRGMLEKHVRNAEILVVAAGYPGLVKGEWIKEGAIVIDAGITAVEDKIVGDVDFKEARKRAAYITPVPGGVGILTTAYLMKNTVEALKWQLAAD
ncbi:bifunctional 5,10-methylenetetrahydrofolate dehydrogenase/5,10-methenyltetrahydrofolate cyclohydrolase [Thermosyntropha sp.]|uniref:bifunctional 5,10-methylenetetrahydrofolate dehydrogenase/5,10-methenyltetrahydrofolate cyclohydrolase n=1 Tax=Thermosyntropha sp. TaxID=2740820 RepID=UPI0025F41130|nr:bifunctional 5,10-methylenetetrahydrofolate dehydrogenase/5,10-methenyltetrahydrofolate cyclohydrolase [Thermosyntropha sp.]MBO8159195.1 bifunctional 5,10-methylenetetrahydrofolate dehydrogenase/5,10-methenyltetrahydrofolate cyclohydrolase [Thermosyntropha sp.]